LVELDAGALLKSRQNLVVEAKQLIVDKAAWDGFQEVKDATHTTA
jgi:hypothetical protein